jgi:sulfide:quinone oxidoreductase
MSVPKIVIVGGGTAGLTVAAQLLRKNKKIEVTIIEPNDKHYYQPLWTLVGGGVFPKEKSQRNEADYIPRGATWLRDSVESFDPTNNSLKTSGGENVAYDWMVVCPGIQINWTAIKGLSKEIVGTHGICSNYSYETVDTTWKTLREFKSGTALFTHPAGAVKCGGAPQKICYLAEDYFRRNGIRDQCKVIFAAATPRIFAVDKYANALERMIARKGIETEFKHDLVEIRPESKQAVFQILETDQQVTIPYDMIHVTPKMGPPDFVKNSPLAGEGGWVDVDKNTTQHNKFKNVFSLGDSSSLPTSKTGAAIRKQAPVTVANLLACIDGKPAGKQYNGYTSCPLVTSYSRLILAEFDYDGQPQETFPFDQSKERYSMLLLKKHGLPLLYWRGMLRGRA